MTTPPGPTRADRLILARLLVPAKAGTTAAKVAADLSKLDAERFSAGQVAGALEGLRAGGLVEALPLAPTKAGKPPKPPAFVLTAAGREAALRAAGLQKLPSKPTWSAVLNGHLLAVAAGATPRTPPLNTKAALAAHLLRRQFGLDVPENAKLPVVVTAIVTKTLGVPGVSDYKSLEATVLGRLLASPTSLSPKSAIEQFLRDRFESKQGKADDIKAFAVRQWLAGQDQAADAANPAAAAGASSDALANFARAAVDAARHSQTGWFGENKVFISHAWRSYRARVAGRSSPDLADFKGQLVRANTAGLLELSRADLVALMDPADVRESEASYLNTTFHFILIERGRP